MELIKEVFENEFGQMEGKVYFDYIKKYITLFFDKEVPMPYVIKTVNYLNNINENVVVDLCRYSKKICEIKMKNYPDAEYPDGLSEVKDPLEIFNYMQINHLKVDMYIDESDQNIPVLNLGGSCDWDEDNGIQWLIKEDKVVYVGVWDDLDIWYCDFDDYITNYVCREDE